MTENCSDRPLRIGFYSPALPDSSATNGIVTYVRIMRDALRALGHSVVVVTTDHVECDGRVSAISRPSKLRVFREKFRHDDGSHGWVRAHVLNAFSKAKAAGVDVFEIEESHGWASRLAGVPTVMRLHGPHFFVNDGHLDARRVEAESKALGLVSAVTSPTEALLDAMIAQGAQFQIARVIPNPIPLPKAVWNVENADPDQIIFVGRVDHVKGADLAIDAFRKALKQRPSLKFLFVGPGEPVPAPPQVRFLGKLPPETIEKLRLESSLYLCSSRFENFPYVIAEAMALGMPVLSSATFGAMALIKDQVTGRMVTSDLAGAIVDMLDDRARLAEIGSAARKSVGESLSPSRVARESLQLYREVVRTAAGTL